MLARILSAIIAAAAAASLVVATWEGPKEQPAKFEIPYPAPGYQSPTLVGHPTGWYGKIPGACNAFPNPGPDDLAVGLPSAIIGDWMNKNCGRTIEIIAVDNTTIIARKAKIIDSTQNPQLMVVSNAIWRKIDTFVWNPNESNANRTIGGWRYDD